jgi:hypothetical protein
VNFLSSPMLVPVSLFSSNMVNTFHVKVTCKCNLCTGSDPLVTSSHTGTADSNIRALEIKSCV